MRAERGQAHRQRTQRQRPRTLATFLLAAFLLAMTSVPLARAVLPDNPGDRPFRRFAASLPDIARTFGRDGFLAANRAALARMDDFETSLERGSALLRWLLPAAQWLFSNLGAGNERVYPGRGGWLFYRPGIDYLTGPGFLAGEVLERRRGSAPSWREPPQPDPLRALLDFHRQLEARGVRLLVMPTPTKAMVYPDALSPAFPSAGAPIQNPSFAAFRTELERSGAVVFDPTATLLAARPAAGNPRAAGRRADGPEVFLRTDSHWSPEGVDAVARELAARVRDLAPGAGGAVGELRREERGHRAQGDLARMLELPPWQRLYPRETARLARVVDRGRSWRPDPGASVLLLGDSFTNVFSQPELGWGDGAGLAEQLGFHLGRPVDRIAINDGSAAGVRRRLAREIAGGRDRLAGKEVVVYQIAVRELTTGDWTLVRLPPPAPTG